MLLVNGSNNWLIARVLCTPNRTGGGGEGFVCDGKTSDLQQTEKVLSIFQRMTRTKPTFVPQQAGF